MKKKLLLFITLTTSTFITFAQPIYNEAGIRLHKVPSQEEIEWARSRGYDTLRTTPTSSPVGQIRPIAEWEPMEAVLIRHPFGIPMSLIIEMAKDIKVITIVASASAQNTVLNQYISNGVNIANCEFLIANSDTYWTRDYGPWFIAINNSEMAMYDFTYNRPRPSDNQINNRLAIHLSSNGPTINRYASSLNLCGGNFMNDGIFQAASTTLTLTENSSYTTAQIQQHFLDYMGIEAYHFIADPIVPYDNIQHIDCWSKFLAPDKVLVSRVPANNPNYAKFEAAANYFASLTSSYGTPMQVFRIDTPGATSSSPRTPYTNSLILNNKVFVPINATTNANDLAALQVYQEAMPGYEIIGINYTGWLNTDALHCRTHEIADRCMLYIKHQPYFAEIENTGSLTFSTELYSYCNNTIYSDSVIVYLRAGTDEYEAHNMAYLGNNTWEVHISGLPNGLIEYYVFVADESGRREHHPYIGAPDPHKFILINLPPAPVLCLDKMSSSVYLEELAVIEDHITVFNLGNADLIVEVTDIDFDEMLMIDPQYGTIPEGDSLRITLSYNFNNFAKIVEYFGSFNLISNDPENPETEITLYASYNNLGVNEIDISRINIYPNPTTGELRIENGELKIGNVAIFDMVGRKLLSHRLNTSSSNHLIHISHLQAGIYFVRIQTDAGDFVTKKILKL
ncbi:MAG: agmatine deiminase family protein [Bacteroidales bacterium]|nr:agmatine deiminase family protein [Bacteroidales bacterium]